MTDPVVQEVRVEVTLADGRKAAALTRRAHASQPASAIPDFDLAKQTARKVLDLVAGRNA